MAGETDTKDDPFGGRRAPLRKNLLCAYPLTARGQLDHQDILISKLLMASSTGRQAREELERDVWKRFPGEMVVVEEASLSAN